MKKKIVCLLTMSMIAGLLAGCGQSDVSSDGSGTGKNTEVKQNKAWETPADAVSIALSDNGITVDGQAIATDESADVYAANDIVFYLADQGFTYGEGEAEDEHTQEEADAHTVVHITKPGEYVLSGALSAGQIAIDLGKEAEEDPSAVVTLYLNGVDVSCDVAPAFIFCNVYECGSTDEEAATKDVDTSKAGANVVIVDDTVNTVNGSYVARIYKSYTLNDAGTEVIDNKKLHKYDGVFYSKMSMNVDGGDADTGILNINAENEGLDTELHLTINGGIININSGNDGINTNEDNISVTTLNGGRLSIVVNSFTYLIISNESLSDEGGYTLWNGETQVAQGTIGMNGMGRPGMGGFGGFEGFQGGEMPQMPERGFQGGNFPSGEIPSGGFQGGKFQQGTEKR